jgi:Domain of unknown function (DUF4157)
MNARVLAHAKPSATPAPPGRSNLLQRKCACGGTPGPTGECEECRKKRRSKSSAQSAGHDFGKVAVGPQPKFTINQAGDRFEQEADRMADYVVNGRGSAAPSTLSPIATAAVQREDAKPTPPKPDNYDEAVKKILEALQETGVAKQLKAKAAELGKDFLSSVEGKVIAGGALGGALAGIIATNSELPMQVPELPLDFIAPGLKAKLTWEGPVRSPTNVGLALTSKGGVSVAASYTSTPATGEKPAEEKAGLTLTIPLGGTPAKPKSTESASDKYRAETARMGAEQRKFREGLKTPEQKAEDKAFWESYWRMKANEPLNPLARPGTFGPTERKKEEELLQRKSPNGSCVPATAPPIVDDVLAESGQPLDSATREFMETRFGYDFGRVRIHTDTKAAESTRAVNAHAYTVGDDVVFGAGRYVPSTAEGQKLIAHELAHVVQQSGSSLETRGELTIGPRVDGRAQAAETLAKPITRPNLSLAAMKPLTTPGVLIQRQDEEGAVETSGRKSWSLDHVAIHLRSPNTPSECEGWAWGSKSVLVSSCRAAEACAPRGKFEFRFDFSLDVAPPPPVEAAPASTKAKRVTLDADFTTNKGAKTFGHHEADDKPVYVSQGKPLATTLGRSFSFSTSDSGVLSIKLGLEVAHAGGVFNLLYQDDIPCNLIPCA